MNQRHILARILVAALVIPFLSIFLASCNDNGQTWQRIQSSGVLRVGLDPTFPPFETADSGELRGIDVDLARAIARQLSLEAEFIYFGYDGLYDALATEQVDVLISALVIRSDQLRDFAYSKPYFNAGERLVVPRLDSVVEGVDDIAGHTLAVELGARGHVLATEWQRQYRDLTVEPYQTPQDALSAVSRGADAALVDTISALVFVAGNDGLRVLEPPVTVEPFACVVRIEDERLLQEINRALETLDENGQLQSIISHHMGAAGES